MFSFLRRRATQAEHPSFAAMPVKMISVGTARQQVAAYVQHGTNKDRLPIVCMAGYARNMLDFADFVRNFHQRHGRERTLIALDFPGRGRSSSLPAREDYSTLKDADAAIDALIALGVRRAIFLGQGHGGQVAMLIARKKPLLLGGTILVDAGPVTDPRGIVRVRNNFKHIAALKSGNVAQEAARKIAAADYPGEPEARLDELIARQYKTDDRGTMRPLFDAALIAQLEAFDFDDVLEPQWPLFDALAPFPLKLVRTQLSDQLRRETFDEMARRRPDAARLSISGEGSPALLDRPEELQAIAQFCAGVDAPDPDDVAVA